MFPSVLSPTPTRSLCPECGDRRLSGDGDIRVLAASRVSTRVQRDYYNARRRSARTDIRGMRRGVGVSRGVEAELTLCRRRYDACSRVIYPEVTVTLSPPPTPPPPEITV